MIRIICTNCKNELDIDDAFAGGVCRCQHCGTIQTVPAHLKATGARPTAREETQRTLFVGPTRGAANSPAGESSLAQAASHFLQANKVLISLVMLAFVILTIVVFFIHH